MSSPWARYTDPRVLGGPGASRTKNAKVDLVRRKVFIWRVTFRGEIQDSSKTLLRIIDTKRSDQDLFTLFSSDDFFYFYFFSNCMYN